MIDGSLMTKGEKRIIIKYTKTCRGGGRRLFYTLVDEWAKRTPKGGVSCFSVKRIAIRAGAYLRTREPLKKKKKKFEALLHLPAIGIKDDRLSLLKHQFLSLFDTNYTHTLTRMNSFAVICGESSWF